MILLTVGNSVSQISGLSSAQFAEVKRLLSYKLPNAYASGSPRYPYRSLLSKRGEFPSGLLYLLEQYLGKFPHEVRDTRKRPITPKNALGSIFIPGSYPTPYPEQIDAAAAAVNAHRGIISAVTGCGKSLMIGLLYDFLRVSTLVVVPSLELKKQLTASFMTWFGPDHVGKTLHVQNVDALDPNKPADVDCVVLDEYHRSAARTYRKLNQKAWKDVYYRFGFTATPFRSNDDERLLLESILSKVIYTLDYRTAVAKGYIVPVEAWYVDLPKQEIQGDETNWRSVYSELVVNNKKYHEIVTKLLSRFLAQGIPTLCLVKEIQHGRVLSESTGVDFANGEDSDNTRINILRFNLGEIKALIGTSGILGEGVDTRLAEIVIIAGGGKAKTQFMQQIGRGLRTYPGKTACWVVIFKNSSHKWLRKHFNEQVKILREEYGVVPGRLEIA